MKEGESDIALPEAVSSKNETIRHTFWRVPHSVERDYGIDASFRERSSRKKGFGFLLRYQCLTIFDSCEHSMFFQESFLPMRLISCRKSRRPTKKRRGEAAVKVK